MPLQPIKLIMMLAVNPLSSVCTNVHRDQYCTTRIEFLVILSFTHFYGRAAAELSFSEGILRTFTGVREAVSFSHCNTTCSVSPNMSYSARKNMKARGVCVVATSTPMTPPLAFSPRMRCALLSARRCRASEF